MYSRSVDKRTDTLYTLMSSCRLIGSIPFRVLLMTIALIAMIASVQPAHAVDELFLTGVVKSIDRKSDLVTVQVTSAGCRGIRNFRSDQRLDLLENYVGKIISFYIDSSTCEDRANHVMLVSWGISK